MQEKIIRQSQKFWKSLEKADSKGMREKSAPSAFPTSMLGSLQSLRKSWM